MQIFNGCIILLQCVNDIYIENPDELNSLRLRLRHSKTLKSDFTEEQDEYNYIQSINTELNIKSKYEYINNYNKENHREYIDDPFKYFKIKGVWKDWYNFLGVDTTKFISTKEEWKIFCKKNKITSSNYKDKCNEFAELPPELDEIYVNFTNINNELGNIRYHKR